MAHMWSRAADELGQAGAAGNRHLAVATGPHCFAISWLASAVARVLPHSTRPGRYEDSPDDSSSLGGVHRSLEAAGRPRGRPAGQGMAVRWAGWFGHPPLVNRARV